MDWADLFERAGAYETDAETIREALAERRAGDADGRADDADRDANGVGEDA